MPERRKISLVIADVDGTLVTDQKTLTDRAIAAVQALRKAGVKFAITSGRPPRGMAMLIEPLALYGPIGGFNGGVYVRPDLSVIQERLLEPAVVRDTVQMMREQGLGVWLYTATDWFVTDAAGPHVTKEASTVRFEPIAVADFDALPSGIAKVVGISDNYDLVSRCETELQSALHGRASASRSQPYYVDVTHRDANKGAVADFLSVYLSVPQAEIATIGDSPNDVLMFKRSGFSIAMGNASDRVKAEANATTDSNQNEGFA